MGMTNRETKYWIAVAAKDHVKEGISKGIAQACHGKSSPLRRMKKGDYVIYYSGKLTLEKSEKCQEFTALGKVIDDEVYKCKAFENFSPSRRNIAFEPCRDIPILPLIAHLEFISNKKFGVIRLDLVSLKLTITTLN